MASASNNTKRLLYPIFITAIIITTSFPNTSSAQTAAVQGGYWFPESGFPASSIDSSLFTHLFYAFAGVDSATYQVTVPSANNATFTQFTATVKSKNPNVRTLLSLGGGSADRTTFSRMAAQASSRQAFIASSIKLARAYGFSGLDLDWEYPQTSSDMTNLGTLLAEWRQAVAAEASAGGRPALLLTAAFYYQSNLNGLIYPSQSINANLDWVNLMAYDFYDPSWYRFTNSHSMLYDPSTQVSGSYGVGAWGRSGVALNKLVLGIPFYGYSWVLANANNHGLLAPASSGGGAIGYNQIRSFIAQNGAAVVYNGTIVTNYCYLGTTWIGYDDVQSVSAKASYAKKNGLLGYFAWHVGVDNNWALSQQAKQTWQAS